MRHGGGPCGVDPRTCWDSAGDCKVLWCGNRFSSHRVFSSPPSTLICRGAGVSLILTQRAWSHYTRARSTNRTYRPSPDSAPWQHIAFLLTPVGARPWPLHPRNLHLVESISDFESMVTRNTHDEMECYMVDTWVNNPAHDTPECLALKKENPPDGT